MATVVSWVVWAWPNTLGGDEVAIRIQGEADLGTLPPLPIGTVAEFPQLDGTLWRYYAVGNTTREIASRLGWTQGNVWLREPERRYMLLARPDVFTSLEHAIAHVVARPESVHENDRAPGGYYVIASGAALRAAGLLRSRSTRLVDVTIEVRAVLEGSFLRLFHFAPAARNQGGRQLWP